MIIEEIMKKNIVSLCETDSIAMAIQAMDEHKVRHLPITDPDGKLVGLISDRDIRDATPSIFHIGEEYRKVLNKPVKSIMTTKLITGHPLDFAEEVAAVLYEHRIGCLPILKNNKLVGMVTETDLLHTFVEMTGVHQPGSQIEIKVANVSMMLQEITSIIHQNKANILSVLIHPDKEEENSKIIVIRIQTMNPARIITALKTKGYQVLWPNLPGMSL
ncbi:acetoin utilization AcuB family protein [Bacillaceae bacterium Marseille-Q3522]|nr:acetoin utilization AcuB family protein [Bacillaceae bacterium Marseille-Q3522]